MSFSPSDLPSTQKALASLRASATFRRFRQAFGQVTGLTLQMLLPETLGIRSLTAQDGAASSPSAPSFCALMARRSSGCLSCLEEEKTAVAAMGSEPAFFECFAGLRRVVVPVRTANSLFAVLQTGPLLPQSPTAADLHRLARQLQRRGVEPAQQPVLREAFRSTVVVPSSQEHAAISLLQTFAEHLGMLAGKYLLDFGTRELSATDKAVRIIHDQGKDGPLRLGQVAREVGLSARHLSEVFHRATGTTFVAYLARIRVEHAQQLLRRSSLRVSEVAERAGFRSLSQFNRTFQRLAGQPPRAYRAKHRHDEADDSQAVS